MDEVWPCRAEEMGEEEQAKARDTEEKEVLKRIVQDLAEVKRSAMSSVTMLIERGEVVEKLEEKSATLVIFAETISKKAREQRLGMTGKLWRMTRWMLDVCLWTCGECDDESDYHGDKDCSKEET